MQLNTIYKINDLHVFIDEASRTNIFLLFKYISIKTVKILEALIERDERICEEKRNDVFALTLINAFIIKHGMNSTVPNNTPPEGVRNWLVLTFKKNEIIYSNLLRNISKNWRCDLKKRSGEKTVDISEIENGIKLAGNNIDRWLMREIWINNAIVLPLTCSFKPIEKIGDNVRPDNIIAQFENTEPQPVAEPLQSPIQPNNNRSILITNLKGRFIDESGKQLLHEIFRTVSIETMRNAYLVAEGNSGGKGDGVVCRLDRLLAGGEKKERRSNSVDEKVFLILINAYYLKSKANSINVIVDLKADPLQELIHDGKKYSEVWRLLTKHIRTNLLDKLKKQSLAPGQETSTNSLLNINELEEVWNNIGKAIPSYTEINLIPVVSNSDSESRLIPDEIGNGLRLQREVGLEHERNMLRECIARKEAAERESQALIENNMKLERDKNVLNQEVRELTQRKKGLTQKCNDLEQKKQALSADDICIDVAKKALELNTVATQILQEQERLEKKKRKISRTQQSQEAEKKAINQEKNDLQQEWERLKVKKEKLAEKKKRQKITAQQLDERELEIKRREVEQTGSPQDSIARSAENQAEQRSLPQAAALKVFGIYTHQQVKTIDTPSQSNLSQGANG